MYYLYNEKRKQYITSTVSLRNGGYALYYGEKPTGARWATLKGAENCIARLERSTLPANHSVKVVFVE